MVLGHRQSGIGAREDPAVLHREYVGQAGPARRAPAAHSRGFLPHL